MAVAAAALVAALLGPAAAVSAGATFVNDSVQGSDDDGEEATQDTDRFGDDDGSDHEPALDALAAHGVLAGTECGEDSICPGETIKRRVLAVWLARVLGETAPEAPESSPFADVDASEWWLPHAVRLVELGVLGGCGDDGDSFCPDAGMTRSEAAAVLAAAFGLEASGRAGLTDIGDNSDADAIDALVSAGIAEGCDTDPRRFCPAGTVSRGEMATSLARALGLVPLSSWVRFSAMAAGGEHACGLRTVGTVTCWGNNSQGQADPPEGRFSRLAAGRAHTCGTRTDDSVHCWGDNRFGQTDAPRGRFTHVTAGAYHSCGLRSDGTLACWGATWEGQADTPGGRFRDVAAGGSQSCARRVDMTVVCWGLNDHSQADSPEGSFRVLALGDSYSCGLRTDSTIACWGHSDMISAPVGEFSAIAAGAQHSCALRTDGSVDCWGEGIDGQTDPPDGQFIAVAAGGTFSCGLRADGTAECWGHIGDDRSSPPEGQFIAVAAGDMFSCGLRADGTAECWGHQGSGRAHPPEGPFSAIAGGGGHACALRTDHGVECWGDNHWGQADAPEGRFIQVAAAEFHSCGIRADESVECWGADGRGQADAPEGRFIQVAAAEFHSCGIRADGSVECWGANWWGQADAPRGEFIQVAAARFHSCGIRADGSIACWGDNHSGQADAPEGQFSQIAAGDRHSCGIRADGSIACWGDNFSGQADAPEGRFSQIAAGDRHSCGLGITGTVACWGIVFVAPPLGARRVIGPNAPDPENCKPYGLVEHITAGFPLPAWAPTAIGTVRVAVLFVDFPNAEAAHSTRREAELGLPYTEQYLETASYGRLDMEFFPLHRWLRAEHGYDHYLVEGRPGLPRGPGLSFAIVEEAVRLADDDFDFTGMNLLIVVAPGSHFDAGHGGGRVVTEEGTLESPRINTDKLDEPGEPKGWGYVAAHELTHKLGLLDLYSYDWSHHARTDAPAGQAWVSAEFGLMGLRGQFLTDEADPRLRHVWHGPYTDIGYHYRPRALEMLAWSRWQLGWLDPKQILCVDRARLEQGSELTVALSPVAAPVGGISMAAIPLSATELIVVESRRRTGYDQDERYEDGDWVTTFPSLLTEGVLVYTVDASIASGQLPLKLAGDTGDGQLDDYPILTPGDSVEVRGHRITVTADGGDTHTVTITRLPEE